MWQTLDGETTYKKSEGQLIAEIQQGWCHLYPEDTRNPYIPLAAKGPWIITMHGAVLHDNGGYGMLGFGHSPEVMAPYLRITFVINRKRAYTVLC